MKILIKGAGDLATGIACRLVKSGFDRIIMTETAVPTTVRRTVAFSRAVYEKTATVEGLKAVLSSSLPEAEAAFGRGEIAVMVDEKAEIIKDYKPDILIDAILAKKNLGTAIKDAGLVIGVGPGFTAGTDCHCVIETKRGHYLGRVITSGAAIPNTGIPGEIGGYSAERIIRAVAEGEFEPLHEIGDRVEKGEPVARSAGVDIYAQMPGIIRGMLQAGVHVVPGMKAGDIDARCEPDHCYSVSDKARAIGGGVLEAVAHFANRRRDMGIVLLAAGEGKRFGDNKLLQLINGSRLFESAADAAADCLKAGIVRKAVIVTGYDELAEYATEKGIAVVRNNSPELGISRSLQLGLKALSDCGSILFSVSDQPGLSTETFTRLINAYAASDKGLACIGSEDMLLGNPCIFSSRYYGELMELTGDRGGKKVIRRHTDDLVTVIASDYELKDIDTRDDIG